MHNTVDVSATFTVAQLADVNAIKTAVATNVAAQEYETAALNGALANPGPAAMRMPQYPTITASSSAGSYSLSPVVFTGTNDAGEAITVPVTPTNANGNWTVAGTTAMKTCTKINVPGQVDGSGQWEFGMQDVVGTAHKPIVKVRGGTQANIVVEYDGGVTDTLPCEVGEKHEMLATKVLATGTTCDPVTIYRGKSPYHGG
jgi:hypothetical protein